MSAGMSEAYFKKLEHQYDDITEKNKDIVRELQGISQKLERIAVGIEHIGGKIPEGSIPISSHKEVLKFFIVMSLLSITTILGLVKVLPTILEK